MRLIKIFCQFLILALTTSSSLMAQGISEEDKYDTEIIGGINFNTNANIIGGLMGSYSKRINANQFHYFGVEVINVKHPKEVRVGSQSTGNLFIHSKVNHLIPIRLQYGRSFVLFHPAEEEGVQVCFIAAGGPTIGIVKPYMIEYNYGNYSKIEKYDPDKTTNIYKILGAAGIFSGLGLSKISPGINVKTSFSFQFSQFLGSVTGIEVGGLLEVFPKKIILLAVPSHSPQPQNYSAFSSIFINVFFGSRK